jgi:TPR repeat protein
MYQKGKGVPKNRLTSYVWYSLAAKKLQEAGKSRNNIRRGLTRKQITEAKELVRKFKVNKPKP